MRNGRENRFVHEQCKTRKVCVVMLGDPILTIDGLSKSYGAIRALNDVTMRLAAGEVVGLVGDNGAGKSTLVKCVSGMTAPDGGRIVINGESVTIRDALHARELGIETVQQDLALVDSLDVTTNLFLNREICFEQWWLRGFKVLRRRAMNSESRRKLASLSIELQDLRARVESLSGGQRQGLAIARAAGWARQILLLDEPTAALGVAQSRLVMDLIQRLAKQGLGIVVITHNMEEVMDVCSRVVVLRHGRKVGDVPIEDADMNVLVSLITGATGNGSGE